MENQTNLRNQEAIDKLKELAEGIDMCLFCTNLKEGDGESTRPMSTQGVDDDGTLWFFSDKNSLKNDEIKKDKSIRLYYSQPSKSSFMVLNGDAEIVFDRKKVEELWSPHVKAWFTEGIDDPSISLLKVSPKSAYYWDVEGNKMINFFKYLASIATGAELIDAKEGNIKV
jgi:general stress protein 26